MFNFTSTNFFEEKNFSTILFTNFLSIVLLSQLFPSGMFRRYPICLVTLLSFISAFFLSEIFLRFLPKIVQQQTNLFGSSILIGIFLGFTFDKILRFSHRNNDEIVALLYLIVDFLYQLTHLRHLFTINIKYSNVFVYSILHIIAGFIVLIHTEWTSIKAMFALLMNILLSSIVSFYLLDETMTDEWIYPLMTGIFIYISTVHLMPIIIDQNHGFRGVFAKINAVIFAIVISVYLKENQ